MSKPLTLPLSLSLPLSFSLSLTPSLLLSILFIFHFIQFIHFFCYPFLPLKDLQRPVTGYHGNTTATPTSANSSCAFVYSSYKSSCLAWTCNGCGQHIIRAWLQNRGRGSPLNTSSRETWFVFVFQWQVWGETEHPVPSQRVGPTLDQHAREGGRERERKGQIEGQKKRKREREDRGETG